MSDPVSDLKRELLAAAERQQARAVPARRNLRRWLLRSDVQQGRRGRHLVALFAALVVAVGAASAIGSVRDFILDRGFVGLPPEGATPSTPESGELALRWLGRSETLGGRPLVRVWVYADGRIIWSRSGRIPEGASELTSGYLEQRLTPQGVELLRSEVLKLLEASRTPLETVPTDDDPRGGTFGVEVRDGDRLVRLREQSEGTSALPEQLSARRRIDALLTDPASVLPSSAWAVREVRAYVPSHYAVCIDTAPPKDASHLLSLLPPRAADLLRYKRRTSSEADVLSNIDQVPGHMVVIGRSVTHCSKLTTEEAREVAKALAGLDPDPRFHTVVLAYLVAEGVHDWERTAIWFEPYFPHGQFTRSDSG